MIHTDFIKLTMIMGEEYCLSLSHKLVIPEKIVINEIDKNNIPNMLNGFYRQVDEKIRGELSFLSLDFMKNYINEAVRQFTEFIHIV
jgi:hypothetical protein